MGKRSVIESEEGFVLIVSMVMLLLLTLLGIWALNTSTVEIQIAGNQQQFDKSFNIAEGGANFEATFVGFAVRSEYSVTNPGRIYQDLTTGTYGDSATWPVGSLLLTPTPGVTTGTVDPTAYDPGTDPVSEYKYRYFVTYLYPDVPPKGYDASMFSSYKFRIDGERDVVIELGGIKIGVKASM